MTGHPIFRFHYDGLRIGVEVGNKPLNGRKILSDHTDSPLKKSIKPTVKNHLTLLSLKIDDPLLRHCGYFTVGQLNAGLSISEGSHYIVSNFGGLGLVCNVRIFVEGEVKVHQIAGDSKMF
jgi:hypothetical protein